MQHPHRLRQLHLGRLRVEAWRDVRVGLARSLDEVQRTYVARLDSYPNVVGQLFSAAVDRGLSSRTKVVAVGDGGNGIREELTVQLPNLRFILDRAHLKEHLYDTAEAIGLKDAEKHRWVSDKYPPEAPQTARRLLEARFGQPHARTPSPPGEGLVGQLLGQAAGRRRMDYRSRWITPHDVVGCDRRWSVRLLHQSA